MEDWKKPNIGKYRTNIIGRIKWYFGSKTTPPPAWFYPTDGWIEDPEEIERAIRLDDRMGLANEPTEKEKR